MSLLKNLFPSMFHRRLLLIIAGAGLAASILGYRMSRLAIGRGPESLAIAESKLIRRQMTPTVRGRILDRKGRVLAQDRPSYDIAIAYEVLTGTWAAARAKEFTSRAYREQWPDLSSEQRAELIERATRAYEQHIARGWTVLAATAGIPIDDLNKSRDDALAAIKRMHDSTSSRRLHSRLAAFRERNGREPDAGELKTISRQAAAPLREMLQPRVVLPRISDKLAFAFQSLAGEETDLRPLGDDPGARAIDPLPRIPGLHVFDAGDRDYPMDSMIVEVDGSSLPEPIRTAQKEQVYVEGVASHVLGWMRQVWVEDENTRRELLLKNRALSDRVVLDLPGGISKDRGEYLEGDRVGQVGIEGALENTLRGLRGMRTRSLDSGRTEEIPPEPGHDVKLTIDMMLQARVQAAMTPSLGLARVEEWHRSSVETANPTMPIGTPINGAAVIVDIDTGEILAMVSTPPVPLRLRRDDPDAVFDDPLNLPYLNRAINRPYPPGSIVKPLVFTESVKRGIIQPDHRIECTGHLIPGKPNILQCWIWKRYKQTHSSQLEHDLDGADAIMVSCNIFFFTLGRRLGTDGITQAYADYGVGRTWNLGIGPENGGFIGRGAGRPELELGDATQMGIGQGPITWTPLHAASAYATLARGGVVIPPTVIQNDPRKPPASDHDELDLNASAVAVALEGLRRSVNEELGAGHSLSYVRHGVTAREPIFNIPGLRIIGKTGTATAPDLKLRKQGAGAEIDEIGREDENDGMNPSETRDRPAEVVRSGDHSWFVVLAGREGQSPRYAISVVMEYAGSGGRVSGPIANQIVHALVEEGYLTPAPVAPSTSPPPRDAETTIPPETDQPEGQG